MGFVPVLGFLNLLLSLVNITGRWQWEAAVGGSEVGVEGMKVEH